MHEQLDTNLINSKADDLVNKANNMKNILDDTTSKIKIVGTSDDVWNSNAAQSFKAKYDALSRKFEMFVADVNAYANFLKSNVAAAYDAVDKKAEREMENI